MLMPVNKTACPVADWGKPFTPSAASRGRRVARSPTYGADFANNLFPPSRLCRNGISRRANGLMLGLSTPRPTPSRKMNKTCICTNNPFWNSFKLFEIETMQKAGRVYLCHFFAKACKSLELGLAQDPMRPDRVRVEAF